MLLLKSLQMYVKVTRDREQDRTSFVIYE